MKNYKKNRPLFFIFLMLLLATCGSKPGKNNIINKKNDSDKKKLEELILKKYTETRMKKYEDFLVNINNYTTNGKIYHKKYYKYLIGIAADITEDKNFVIMDGSIGFYYDKKSYYRNRLYLGLDIDTRVVNNGEYVDVALKLLKNYIKDIIDTVNSCFTIFREKDVVGMVIGFKWHGYRGEQVNMWINEADVQLFEKNLLTFNELVQKSIITNTAGNIIKLL